MDVVGYIRVSRVGGRKGDSFVSPEEQRRAILRLADAKGLKVVKWYEELDASGGSRERPEWLKARDMIGSGKAKGVVVLNFSRWSRDSESGPASVKAIRAAGGEIWSVQEDFDTTTPEGWYMLVNFFAMAEMFRNQAVRNSHRVRASAIERGIYIAKHAPFGYQTDPQTRRLVPDPTRARIVVELFERRAKGESWVKLATWLRLNGGSPTANRTSVRDMIFNRAYLGEARSGEDLVNRKAHPPLVSQKLFDAAGKKGSPPRHDGSVSSRTLLAPRCGNCGYRMQANWSQGRTLPNGKREKIIAYSCLVGHCHPRAYIKAHELDVWVVGNLFSILDRVGAADFVIPGADESAQAEAQKRLEAAEYDKQLFIKNRELRRLLTAEEYNSELTTLLEAVEEASIAVEMTETKAPPRIEDVRSLWQGWNNETRREWLRSMVETITVEPSRGKRMPIHARLINHVHVTYTFGWEIGAASSGSRADDETIRRDLVDRGHLMAETYQGTFTQAEADEWARSAGVDPVRFYTRD